MTTLAASLIVRNESDFLEDCLNSIKDIVDEIVIVDTGSVDNTVEIALKFTDKVYLFAWNNNFSDARNLSKSHCNSDWILSIDADEIISAKDIDIIKKSINQEQFDAYTITTYNYVLDSKCENWYAIQPKYKDEARNAVGFVKSNKIRLFKNLPNINFQGHVHEFCLVSPEKVSTLNVPIHHYGKLFPDKTRNKHELYVKLGEQKVQDSPNNMKYLSELGVQYVELQKYDKAIDVFNKILDLEPNNSSAYFNLGISYSALSNFQEASIKYRKAIELKPEYADAYHNLALIYMDQKNYIEAEMLLEKMLLLSPDNINGKIMLWISQSYFVEKENNAIRNLIDIVNESPYLKTATARLAKYFCEKHDYTKAQNYYEDLIKLDPLNAENYNDLGIIFRKYGQLEKCIENYNKAIEIKPNMPEVYSNLANVYNDLKDYDKAIASCQKSLSFSPNNIETNFNLGVIAMQAQDLTLAQEQFDKVLLLCPGHPDSQKALTYLAKNKNDRGSNMNIMQSKNEIPEEYFIPRHVEIKDKPTLSSCIILKNAEKTIRATLESIKPISDEIIIIDTGATDNSIKICREFTNKIYNFVWCDDFAKARNEAFKHATCEWIFSVDSDETIEPTSYEEIKAILTRKDVSGYRVITRNYTKLGTCTNWSPATGEALAKGYTGWYPSYKVRIFRNQVDIFFEGEVHELVGHRMMQAGYKIETTRFVVHHYDHDQLAGNWRAKKEMYLRIGKKKIDKNPNDPKALFEYALQAAELKMPYEALKYFEKVADIDRHFGDACYGNVFYEIGNIYASQLRDFPKSVGYYKQALEDRPNHSASHYNLGNSYQQMGEVDSAIDCYKRAAECKPDFALAWNNYAYLLLKKGKIEESIDIFKKAIALKPDYAAAYNGIGNAYSCLKKYDLAIQYTHLALEKDPNFVDGYYNLGHSHYMLGQKDKSLEYWKKTIDMNPSFFPAYNNLAFLHDEMGHKEQALEIFMKSESVNPMDPGVLNNVGVMLAKCNRRDDAKLRFEKALSISPGFKDATANLQKLNIPQQNYTAGLSTITNQTLCACLIVKNEQDNIENCLKSIKSLVDEIVVLDTGSTDQTKQIASRYTNKIFDFTWNDDFSSARNAALEKTSSDWILMLNADEVISPRDYKIIKECLNQPVDAFVVGTRNYTMASNHTGWQQSDSYPECKNYNGFYITKKVRLFKNNKNYKYEGRLHEIIGNSIENLNGKITQTDWPIHHYGRVIPEHIKKEKQKLYLSIAEKKVQDMPDNAMGYYELGLLYVSCEEIDKAILAFDKSIKLNPELGRNEDFNCYYELGNLYFKQQQFTQAEDFYLKSINLSPNHAESYCYLAESYRKLQNIDKAVEFYNRAIGKRTIFPEAHHGLGILRFKQGIMTEAESYFKKAIEYNSKFMGSYNNLGIIYISQGQEQQALETWKNALAFEPDNCEVMYNLATYYLQKLDYKTSYTYFHKIHNLKSNFKDVDSSLARLESIINEKDKEPISPVPIVEKEKIGEIKEIKMIPNIKALSACIAIKYPTIMLGNCINSINNIVDEILIINSAQGMEEQLSQYENNPKIKILTYDKPYDGADIYNFAMENASGQWLLCLDADEAVRDPQFIQEFIEKNTDSKIGSLHHITVIGNHHCNFRKERLIKKDANLQFEGVVCESIASIEHASLIAKLESTIVYTGHNGPQGEQSINHKIDLIQKALDNNQSSSAYNKSHWIFEQGLLYNYLDKLKNSNNHRQQVIDLWNQCGQNSPISPQCMFDVAAYLSDLYLQDNNFNLALEKSEEAISFKSNSIALPYTIKGSVHMTRKEYDEAIVLFEKMLKIKFEDVPVFVMNQYLFLPYANLTVAYFNVKNYDKTIEMGEEALKIKLDPNLSNILEQAKDLKNSVPSPVPVASPAPNPQPQPEPKPTFSDEKMLYFIMGLANQPIPHDRFPGLTPLPYNTKEDVIKRLEMELHRTLADLRANNPHFPMCYITLCLTRENAINSQDIFEFPFAVEAEANDFLKESINKVMDAPALEPVAPVIQPDSDSINVAIILGAGINFLPKQETPPVIWKKLQNSSQAIEDELVMQFKDIMLQITAIQRRDNIPTYGGYELGLFVTTKQPVVPDIKFFKFFNDTDALTFIRDYVKNSFDKTEPVKPKTSNFVWQASKKKNNEIESNTTESHKKIDAGQMANASISILMPVYNGRNTLRNTIKSVIGQTFTDWNLIIVNDGGENVEDMLVEFNDPRILYFNCLENKGKASALNYAIKKSNSKYIAYLDQDDEYKSEHLNLLYQSLENNPIYSAAHTDTMEYFMVKENDKFVEFQQKPGYQTRGTFAELQRRNIIHTLTVMHKKDVFDKVGLFDESLRCILEDWDMWRRIAQLGDFLYIPQITTKYFTRLTQRPNRPITNDYFPYEYLDSSHGSKLHAAEHKEKYAYIVSKKLEKIDNQKTNTIKLNSTGYFDPILPQVEVCILTPTFNRPDLLRRAIQSVLSQTFEKFEMVIVNDGGQDVRQIIKSFCDPRLKYINLTKNIGKSGCLNVAIRNSNSKYIAYLDDDDLYLPNHLETLVNGLKNNPSYKAVHNYTLETYVLKMGDDYREIFRRELHKVQATFAILQKQNIIFSPTAMHHRDVFEKIDLYDEYLTCLIDWDMFRRIAQFGDFLYLHNATTKSIRRINKMPDKERINDENYLYKELIVKDHITTTTDEVRGNMTNHILAKPLERFNGSQSLDPRLIKRARTASGAQLTLYDEEVHKFTMTLPKKKQKISAIMQVKNGEQYLKATLDEMMHYVEDMVVLDDGSTDSTVEILKQYPKIVKIIQNPPGQLWHEGNNKNKLMVEVGKLNPDWVLAIDADEIFPEAMRTIIYDLINNPVGIEVFIFDFPTFWRGKTFFRTDGVWKGQMRERLFKYRPGLIFATHQMQVGYTPFDRVTGQASPMGVCTFMPLQHYGYCDYAECKRKYENYEKVDTIKSSAAIGANNYKHLVEENNLRLKRMQNAPINIHNDSLTILIKTVDKDHIALDKTIQRIKQTTRLQHKIYLVNDADLDINKLKYREHISWVLHPNYKKIDIGDTFGSTYIALLTNHALPSTQWDLGLVANFCDDNIGAVFPISNNILGRNLLSDCNSITNIIHTEDNIDYVASECLSKFSKEIAISGVVPETCTMLKTKTFLSLYKHEQNEWLEILAKQDLKSYIARDVFVYNGNHSEQNEELKPNVYKVNSTEIFNLYDSLKKKLKNNKSNYKITGLLQLSDYSDNLEQYLQLANKHVGQFVILYDTSNIKITKVLHKFKNIQIIHSKFISEHNKLDNYNLMLRNLSETDWIMLLEINEPIGQIPNLQQLIDNTMNSHGKFSAIKFPIYKTWRDENFIVEKSPECKLKLFAYHPVYALIEQDNELGIEHTYLKKYNNQDRFAKIKTVSDSYFIDIINKNSDEVGCYVKSVNKDLSFQKVSIIVPVYNEISTVKWCLDSIARCTKFNYEIVVVDNKYSSDTTEYLKNTVKTPNILVSPTENIGFAKACNLGAQHSTGDVFVFLNSDTIVSTSWLTNALNHLANKRIGLLSCITNYASGLQQIPFINMQLNEANIIPTIEQFADTQYKSHKDKLVITNHLIGFCLFITKNMFQQIGKFDEQFLIGNSEDIDISFKIIQAGYYCAVARDVFIFHFGNRGFNNYGKQQAVDPKETYQRLIKENASKLYRKWPNFITPDFQQFIHGSIGKPIEQINFKLAFDYIEVRMSKPNTEIATVEKKQPEIPAGLEYTFSLFTIYDGKLETLKTTIENAIAENVIEYIVILPKHIYTHDLSELKKYSIVRIVESDKDMEFSNMLYYYLPECKADFRVIIPNGHIIESNDWPSIVKKYYQELNYLFIMEFNNLLHKPNIGQIQLSNTYLEEIEFISDSIYVLPKKLSNPSFINNKEYMLVRATDLIAVNMNFPEIEPDMTYVNYVMNNASLVPNTPKREKCNFLNAEEFLLANNILQRLSDLMPFPANFRYYLMLSEDKNIEIEWIDENVESPEELFILIGQQIHEMIKAFNSSPVEQVYCLFGIGEKEDSILLRKDNISINYIILTIFDKIKYSLLKKIEPINISEMEEKRSQIYSHLTNKNNQQLKYLFIVLTVKLNDPKRLQRFKEWYNNMLESIKYIDWECVIGLDEQDVDSENILKGIVTDSRFIIYRGSHNMANCKLIHEITQRFVPEKDADVILYVNDDHFIHLVSDLVMDNFFKEQMLIQNNKYVVLHANDCDQHSHIATTTIVNRAYYDLLGYLINPEYAFGYFSDQEATELARKLGVIHYKSDIIIQHKREEYLTEQNSMTQNKFWPIDKETFHKNRSNNYFIDRIQEKLI